MEMFDTASQGERVGRDDADICLDIDERVFGKPFGIDNRLQSVCKHFELIRDSQIVSVAGQPIADRWLTIDLADQMIAKRCYHLLIFSHLGDPSVGVGHRK